MELRGSKPPILSSGSYRNSRSNNNNSKKVTLDYEEQPETINSTQVEGLSRGEVQRPPAAQIPSKPVPL